VAVLMQELLKLPICSLLYTVECGGPLSMFRALWEDARTRRGEWGRMSVPALLYTLQNNCLYLGFLHLEAAVGQEEGAMPHSSLQVTYQSKIFFTALCSVWMLGKKLGKAQWCALVLLAAGVICVQARSVVAAHFPFDTSRDAHHNAMKAPHVFMHFSTSHCRALPSPSACTIGKVLFFTSTLKSSLERPSAQAGDWLHPEKKSRRNPGHAANSGSTTRARAYVEQASRGIGVPSLGLAAFFTAAMCTSFASVYFEKMLKSDSQPSLWLRNIQLAGEALAEGSEPSMPSEGPCLAAYSSIIAAVALLLQNDPTIQAEGYLHGFNSSTWLSIAWQAVGGILVAVTIKYADNILRGFAQALAIIVASLGSSLFSSWRVTPPFVAGQPLTKLRQPAAGS
ncbi:MAG: hypothetical protein SGPRY_008084, partial [Prymnesium sp.]